MIEEGFFTAAAWQNTRVALPLIARCGACKLKQYCLQKKPMAVAGGGKKGVLLVGQAPGKTEDRQGIPFIGDAGQKLQECLGRIGIDLFQDCWVTNSVVCRTHTRKHEDPEQNANRPPTDQEIAYCRPNVFKAIEELQPHTVILLGTEAVKSVIGWLWKEEVGEVSRWVGWNIPHQKPNCWICPTWHPSYVLREKKSQVLEDWFVRHLETAFQHSSKPWKKTPSYRAQVFTMFNAEEAAEGIRKLTQVGWPVAFDFETTTLKPDGPYAEILCCSLSDGNTSFAYPWVGEAIEATKEFLLSDCPKIGANVKFESRWCKKKLKLEPRKWLFDTVIGAHTLDSRKGTAGVKFQAFVQLGCPPYDEHVKPYFRSGGSHSSNRAKEIDPQELLTYCALDSLLEWKLAKKLAPQLGIEL